MQQFDSLSVWFVIGTQHLYGPETLRRSPTTRSRWWTG